VIDPRPDDDLPHIDGLTQTAGEARRRSRNSKRLRTTTD